VFWTKLKNADVTGTVWHQMSEFNFDGDSAKRIEDLFSAATTTTGGTPKKGEDEEGSKAKAIALFDGKRSQNVSIFMGQVRKTCPQLKAIIIEVKCREIHWCLDRNLLCF
jgi:hypothetical protein